MPGPCQASRRTHPAPQRAHLGHRRAPRRVLLALLLQYAPAGLLGVLPERRALRLLRLPPLGEGHALRVLLCPAVRLRAGGRAGGGGSSCPPCMCTHAFSPTTPLHTPPYQHHTAPPTPCTCISCQMRRAYSSAVSYSSACQSPPLYLQQARAPSAGTERKSAASSGGGRGGREPRAGPGVGWQQQQQAQTGTQAAAGAAAGGHSRAKHVLILAALQAELVAQPPLRHRGPRGSGRREAGSGRRQWHRAATPRRAVARDGSRAGSPRPPALTCQSHPLCSNDGLRCRSGSPCRTSSSSRASRRNDCGAHRVAGRHGGGVGACCSSPSPGPRAPCWAAPCWAQPLPTPQPPAPPAHPAYPSPWPPAAARSRRARSAPLSRAGGLPGAARRSSGQPGRRRERSAHTGRRPNWGCSGSGSATAAVLALDRAHACLPSHPGRTGLQQGRQNVQVTVSGGQVGRRVASQVAQPRIRAPAQQQLGGGQVAVPACLRR